MKTLLYILFTLLFIFPLTAQTIRWQNPAWWPDAVIEDGHGITYLARTGGQTDTTTTLAKIGPDGVAFWQLHFSGGYLTMLYDGGGLFVCPKNFTTETPYIRYCDTSGVVQWSYNVPAVASGSTATLDKNGNCIYAWLTTDGSTSTTVHWIKLNHSGEKILDATLPPFPNTETYASMLIGGPIVNASGNIWFAVDVEYAAAITHGKYTGDQGSSTVYAILVSGNTGLVLSKTILYKGQAFIHKDDGHGNRYEYDVDGPPFSGYLAYQDNLLAYGTLHWVKYSVKYGDQLRQDDHSEWRLAMVSTSGSVTTKSYKGNGIDRSSTNRNNLTVSDNNGNYLNHVDIGAGNEIILSGSVARGKNLYGVGNFHVDELIARLNPVTKRFLWTYSNLMPSAGTSQMFCQSVQKLVRSVTTSVCDTTLRVIDVNGRVSSQPLR
jgi:hypothetical protein